MSLTVKRTGGRTPAFDWTERHMADFATGVRDVMVARAFDLGHGLDDQPHTAYRGEGHAGETPDLTSSGTLRRSIQVTDHDRTTATIGMTGAARTYGHYVDADRPFMGLSPGDIAEGERLLAEVAQTAMVPRGPR